MRLEFRECALRPRHVFAISRGAQSLVPALLLRVEHGGLAGIGQACPSGFYGADVPSTRAALEGLADFLAPLDPSDFRSILAEAAPRLNNPCALSALDLALHDWAAGRLGVPLRRMLGLAASVPPTSYTIGLDTIPKMVEKLREFPRFSHYKIKLGVAEDVEIVRALRRETDAVFRVDANCGWEPDETIRKSRELRELGVEFVEQPLPPERLDEMERVRRESALPMVADESSVVPEDLPRLVGRFDGVNVKLVKCGGIAPGLRMLESARALGFRTMIGCMVESTVGCTAAAHLGALADWIDLDGQLLLADDPYEGMAIDDTGAIRLPESPGLGVRERLDGMDGMDTADRMDFGGRGTA